MAGYVVKMPMRFTAFVSVLLGLALATGSPVAGDCLSPTIEITQHEVVRGGELVITGYALGERCYDTGPPPQGQRELGLPLEDIDIYIVQGTDEFLVATGAADSFYKFAVTAVVPPDLTSGPAMVQARWADRVAFSEDAQIVVTDAVPLLSTRPAVATFVPRPSTITAPPTSNPPVTAPATAIGVPSTTATTATEPLDARTFDDGRASQDSSPSVALLIGGAGALVCLLVAIKFARRSA